MSLSLQYDPDPYVRFSEKALELVKHLEVVPGQIVVGGSPESSVKPGYRITANDVKRRVDQLRKLSKAELFLFPGSEEMVGVTQGGLDEELIEKVDGILVPCVYNSKKREDFDGRQAKFESVFGDRIRESGVEIQYTFYLVYSPHAKAYEVAEARSLTFREVEEAFRYWSKVGEFGCYYLEATRIEEPPYELIKSCCKTLQANRKAERFRYGGSVRSYDQLRKLEEIGVQTVHIGTALEKEPESVEEILLKLRKEASTRLGLA